MYCTRTVCTLAHSYFTAVQYKTIRTHTRRYIHIYIYIYTVLQEDEVIHSDRKRMKVCTLAHYLHFQSWDLKSNLAITEEFYL